MMVRDKNLSIAIAADHAGFELKETLIEHLQSQGYEVNDVGTHSLDRTDYPDYAHEAANAVASGKNDLGVLVCGSANGVNMTANKHAGVRSAIAWSAEIASLARQHNDANMLALPARFVSPDEALEILSAFLGAEFEGGRHASRVEKIDQPVKS